MLYELSLYIIQGFTLLFLLLVLILLLRLVLVLVLFLVLLLVPVPILALVLAENLGNFRKSQMSYDFSSLCCFRSCLVVMLCVF